MRHIQLKIDRPDLFEESLKYMKDMYKENYDFVQNSSNPMLFDGKINPDRLDTFYIFGQNYGYLLFVNQNRLILTNKRKKVSIVLHDNPVKDSFLWKTVKIELLNNNTNIDFKLSILGFAESSMFERVFSVMSEEDRKFIEKFVEIKEHHYKTSFIHDDYNIEYQIIKNNLLMFKSYKGKQKIVLDSIFEVLWKEK
jgi:hypothetical protein